MTRRGRRRVRPLGTPTARRPWPRDPWPRLYLPWKVNSLPWKISLLTVALTAAAPCGVGVDVRRDPGLAAARPAVLRRGGAGPARRPAPAPLGPAPRRGALVVAVDRARRPEHRALLALLYLAAYRLPSAGALTALAPLVLMGMAFLVLGERQARLTAGAAVVGVAGVVTLVWQNEGAGTVDPVGVAAAVGAVLSSSLGFVLVKRWAHREDVLVTTTWQLVAGGLLLLPLAAVVEGAPPALDGSRPARPPLPRSHRLGGGVRPVVPRAHPDGCRCRRRRRARQPRRRHRARSPAPRRALRPGPPRRRHRHPGQRPRRPASGCAAAATLARSTVDPAPAGRHLPHLRTKPPAYGGSMAPVSTATLTTPTGPVEIPTIGFGVWQVPEDEVGAAVATALRAGYRHVDTARPYDNEKRCRRALADSDVPRDEVFVTTKVWNDDHGRDATSPRSTGPWNAWASTCSTCTSSTGRCPARTATSRPGGPARAARRGRGAGRRRVQLPRRAPPASSSTRRGSGRASTRSSCTRTSSRRSCGRSTASAASSPSPGARSPRARRCSTTRSSHASPAATAPPGAGGHRVAPRPRPRRAAQVGHPVPHRREPRGGRPHPDGRRSSPSSRPSTAGSAPAPTPTCSTRREPRRPPPARIGTRSRE